MDSGDRVRAALKLEVADRPPIGWWGHTFVEEWSPVELAEATVNRARRYHWDFVKLQPRASSFAEAFGAEYRASGNNLEQPAQIRSIIDRVDDWARLPSVDAGSPELADQTGALSMVVEDLGEAVPVIQTVFSPLMVAGYLTAGQDRHRVLNDLREHPEVVGPALERIARAMADFSMRSVDAGAAGIFYAIAGFAGAGMIGLPEYEDLALEYDRLVLEALPNEAWFNVVHLCGSNIHVDLAAKLGLQALSWAVEDPGNPGLAEARDRTGLAVMGGIDRMSLVDGTPGQVAAQGKAAFAETEGRGLLLAPGCSVRPQAREENLDAIVALGTA
jgi:uroporphyrinogen decarboxylase